METKGITCKIPLDLHNRISEEIRAQNGTMSQFIEQIIHEHYMRGEIRMGKTRTMAFQISEELFQEIKAYLARYEQVYGRRLTQKEFVIGLIESALEEAQKEFEAAEAAQQEDESDEAEDEGDLEVEEDAEVTEATATECGEATEPANQTKADGEIRIPYPNARRPHLSGLFLLEVIPTKDKTIRYIDMFSGIGGFRESLTRAGGFTCVGHSELDDKADQSYCALFDTKGEWYCADARQADPKTMPDFDLLCGGFPCQAFSTAGSRKGFADPRGTLFFELARLAEARHPQYLLFENVPGLLHHDGGRTFAAILHALERLGYHVEWQVLNSKDFGVPQSRRRVYIIGYLDARCAGKIFPFTAAAGTSLVQERGGSRGARVYSAAGTSCTLTAGAGGFGGRTGLYEVGLPIKEATRKGFKMAYPGDSINLSYAATNTHRGRVGRGLAHTLTTSPSQGTLCCVDMNEQPEYTDYARCVTAKQSGAIHNHRREASGVYHGGRIRRLTPRECLRLQGWQDDRIDRIIGLHTDAQLYKQAGNGVTVNVVEAIGRRLAALDAELDKTK